MIDETGKLHLHSFARNIYVGLRFLEFGTAEYFVLPRDLCRIHLVVFIGPKLTLGESFELS